MLVNHKIGVIVAMVFRAFLLQNIILIIAKALYRVFTVSKVTYQNTDIILIIYRCVSLETPCIYFLTNLAQKYHEQIC